METPDFLKAIRAFGGNLTDTERQSLAEMPDLVGEKNPDGSWAGMGPMVVPQKPSGTHEEQLAAFAKLQFYDHEATPAEIQAFVNGGRVETPQAQSPADERGDDAEPESPATDQAPVQPDTSPAVAEPSPVAAPDAPVGNDAVRLPPGHTYVSRLPDGRIVAMFTDESAPRSPARQVILDPKKLRKLRTQTTRAQSVGRTLGR